MTSRRLMAHVTLASKTSEVVTFTVKEAVAGGAGGSGGVVSGGTGVGGAAAGSTWGGAPSAGAPAAGNLPGAAGSAAGSPHQGEDVLADDGGCSVSAPGSRGLSGPGWLLVALISRAARRRRMRDLQSG